nr:hypothetical protein CFP56_72514 [Quercus suber]
MISGLALASLLAIGAIASPISRRQDATFNINVVNSCGNDLNLGVFTLNESGVSQTADTQTVSANGGTATFVADFNAVSQRLSTMDVNNQFSAQSLFEFGYSAFGGITGTAYDLSLIGASTPGMQVVPANSNCETKTCTGSSFPVDQCWTNADQWNIGSPADSTCSFGPTDFTVTYCP